MKTDNAAIMALFEPPESGGAHRTDLPEALRWVRAMPAPRSDAASARRPNGCGTSRKSRASVD